MNKEQKIRLAMLIGAYGASMETLGRQEAMDGTQQDLENARSRTIRAARDVRDLIEVL